MALSKKSISMKVTVFKTLEKLGGNATTTEIRAFMCISSTQKLNQILSDSCVPKSKYLTKKMNDTRVVWFLNEQAKEFIKLHNDKILSTDDFIKLAGGKKIKRLSNNNELEIKKPKECESVINQVTINDSDIEQIQNDLCKSANLSIEGIVRMSESRKQFIKFLIGMPSQMSARPGQGIWGHHELTSLMLTLPFTIIDGGNNIGG